MRFMRETKHFYQRLTRKWDDSDLWNLDVTFAQFIIPRLKEFKKQTNAHPATMTWEEWITILDKMIYGFEKMLEETYYTGEHEKEIKKSFVLLTKYYKHLWI